MARKMLPLASKAPAGVCPNIWIAPRAPPESRMSKIFARLRRATFTILPRAGPLLSFCPNSTPRRAFSVLIQIGRTFRIPSDYGNMVVMHRSMNRSFKDVLPETKWYYLSHRKSGVLRRVAFFVKEVLGKARR